MAPRLAWVRRPHAKGWQRWPCVRHPRELRIVVSGGTGFVGRALCHAIVGRGDEAIILTRGPARDTPHACAECGPGGKVRFVTWTPEKAGPWMDAIEGVD